MCHGSGSEETFSSLTGSAHLFNAVEDFLVQKLVEDSAPFLDVMAVAYRRLDIVFQIQHVMPHPHVAHSLSVFMLLLNSLLAHLKHESLDGIPAQAPSLAVQSEVGTQPASREQMPELFLLIKYRPACLERDVDLFQVFFRLGGLGVVPHWAHEKHHGKRLGTGFGCFARLHRR